MSLNTRRQIKKNMFNIIKWKTIIIIKKNKNTLITD